MDVAHCHHSTKSFPLQGVVLSQVPSRASLLTQESYSTHYLLGNSAITPVVPILGHLHTANNRAISLTTATGKPCIFKG